MRCGVRGRGATAVQAARRGGLDCRLGAGHGEERTVNMLSMSVTLEVSKLSGWLNADADCRESNGGHMVWGAVQSTGRPEVAGEVRPGRWEGLRQWRRERRAGRGPTIKAGGRGYARSAPETSGSCSSRWR